MLYDYLGRTVKTGDLASELAAPSLTGIRTLWDASVASGLTPYRLASLLQAAVSGDIAEYLTLAEEMEERDLHYRCEIGKRRLAVTSLPVTVEAATDAPEDQQLADEIRQLVKLAGFRGLLKDLMDAVGKGFSVCEILWRRGSRWTPERYEWRDQRFFTFDQASRRQLRLLDEANMAEGIELAPYKFIAHLPHLKTGIPIRGGIARVAAWSWMCKSYSVKDWMAFLEVFGMPLRVGKYQPGASINDIAILKAAVANLGSDAAAVIPDSMLIEFVESAKTPTGGHDLFRTMADWLDAQISRGILGQTATTTGTPGKLGSEDAQAEVREDIRDDDAVQLAETLNRDLVKPYIDLNWGPREEYPTLVLSAVQQEDMQLLVNALKELVPLGLKVEQSVIRDKLGLPDPAEGADCLQSAGDRINSVPQEAKNWPEPVADGQNGSVPVSAGQGGPPPAKAARNTMEDGSFPRSSVGTYTPEQQALEDLADKAMANVDLQANEARIVEAVQAAETWDQAIENVLALYPELDMEGLREMTERAVLAAELHGRMVVQDAEGME